MRAVERLLFYISKTNVLYSICKLIRQSNINVYKSITGRHSSMYYRHLQCSYPIINMRGGIFMKRNDPNKKRVKEQLFKTYENVCMVCEKKFQRTELQLHHIKKWENTHKTTLEQSSLVCEKCHHCINEAERNNVKEYNRLNNKIREYKKGRG